MDKNKIIGYVLAILGLCVFVISSQTVLDKITKILPFIGNLKQIHLIMAAVVLVVIGIVLITSNGQKKTLSDVPIYDKTGKKVIGYRRTN